MSYIIAPQLATLAEAVFIDDFPPSQAELAKITVDNKGNQVAKRFELYVRGVEIANGYDELLDAGELRARFAHDNQIRQSEHKTNMPIDEKLLAAMEHGLPACSGVALGLDRLLMIAMDKAHISAVQSFGFLD